MNSSDRKSAFLGMPFGTASNRLRKLILFRLIQKCGDDTCHRCEERIEHLDDMSIEHIRPWQGVDISLFWDLDNIAFSHISCNVSAAKKQPVRSSHKHLRTKDGKKTCKECGSIEGPGVKFRPEEYLCNKCTWTHRMGRKHYT